MPKWTKVRFLHSNSLGIPNLGDNPNNNTTLFDIHIGFITNSSNQIFNLQVLIITSLIESFLLKCLTQN